jgi:hypothetical protein
MTATSKPGVGGRTAIGDMTWDQFGERLSHLFAWLEVGQFLVVSSRSEPSRYVQLMVEEAEEPPGTQPRKPERVRRPDMVLCAGFSGPA